MLNLHEHEVNFGESKFGASIKRMKKKQAPADSDLYYWGTKISLEKFGKNNRINTLNAFYY